MPGVETGAGERSRNADLGKTRDLEVVKAQNLKRQAK
jgi:hypothetical protein